MLFVFETREQQEKSLELLNSNVKELFSFEIDYEHYTFIPNQYDEGTRNKILKHAIPVKVLITTE